MTIRDLMVNWRPKKHLFSRTPAVTAPKLLLSYEKRMYF